MEMEGRKISFSFGDDALFLQGWGCDGVVGGRIGTWDYGGGIVYALVVVRDARVCGDGWSARVSAGARDGKGAGGNGGAGDAGPRNGVSAHAGGGGDRSAARRGCPL